MSESPRLQVTLNGNHTELNPGYTVEDLLRHRGLPDQGVAVEINRELVRRDSFATRALESGDHIEIVSFVGGG